MKRLLSLVITVVMVTSTVGCSANNNLSETDDEDADEETSEIQMSIEEHGNFNIYSATKDGYAVSTASEQATMIGVDVLENGGNAVDAMIAVSYAMGVLEPYASGVGGGGGMLIYDPDTEEFTFLNYLSIAPPSGTKKNYISVPGFVSGMQTAYDLFGTVDFSQLLTYSIDYAENGFEVNSEMATRIDKVSGSLSEDVPYYGLTEGDTLIQTELADTLRTIATGGSDEFYKGSIAEKIMEGTSLTADDLASYETEVMEPVVTTLAGYTVASAPAPFSGLTVLQMLRLMEFMDVPNPSEDPQTYLRDLVTIKMATGSVRFDNIADLTYNGTTLDYDYLLSDEYLSNLVGLSLEIYDEESESEDTTHISIVDANGMAASSTNTLSQFWGSKQYVSGFYMGNSIHNFTSSGVNEYAPGKRARTFTSPTIVLGDNGYVMAAGTPGGNMICNILTTVLSDILLYDTDPQDAVNKQRIIVDSNDTLIVETGLPYDSLVDTEGSGYYLVYNSNNQKFGSVNLAGYDPERGWFATSDIRRLGYGYAYE